MGAWGTGIFDNDMSLDVRGIATDLMTLGLPPHSVSAEIVTQFSFEGDADVILGLAVTQHKAGRVDAAIRAKALEWIDTGRALRQWSDGVEAGDPTIRQRQRQLGKVRALLSAPSPAPKPLKMSDELRRRIDVSFDRFPWRLNRAYGYRLGDATVVFAASAVQETKLGRLFRSTATGYEVVEGPMLDSVILVLLDYAGKEPPTAARAENLRPFYVPPSDAAATATARAIEQIRAQAVESSNESIEAFRLRTRDMLGHFSPERLAARYEETNSWAREQAAALADTEAAVRRHNFQRFAMDPMSPVPRDRLIDLCVNVDTEAAAAAHDFTIKVDTVTWPALGQKLADHFAAR